MHIQRARSIHNYYTDKMANGLRTATKLNVVMPPSLNGLGSSRYMYVYAGVMGDKMTHSKSRQKGPTSYS